MLASYIYLFQAQLKLLNRHAPHKTVIRECKNICVNGILINSLEGYQNAIVPKLSNSGGCRQSTAHYRQLLIKNYFTHSRQNF